MVAMKRFQERASTAVSLLLYSLWTGIFGRAGLRLGEALCEFSAVRLTLGNRRSGRAVLPFCMLVKSCKDLLRVSALWTAFRNGYNVQYRESGWRGNSSRVGGLGLADASCKSQCSLQIGPRPRK